MQAISIDTETAWKNGKNIPFITTTADEKVRSSLYDLRKYSEHKKVKAICKQNNVYDVFHNATYDITCLRNVGIPVCGHIEDTMIQANIINENFESKKLKRLAGIYLNEICEEENLLSKERNRIQREMIKSGELKKGEKIGYDRLPVDVLYPYARKDAEYTMRLWKYFNKYINRFRDVYELELSLIPIIVEMQLNGLRIDRYFCKKMLKRYTKEMNDCEYKMQSILKKKSIVFRAEKIYKRMPKNKDKWDSVIEQDGKFLAVKKEQFNPNSDNHVIKVLEVLTIDTRVYTNTGQMGIDKTALKPFMNVPFVKAYQRYVFLSKQVGTYYGPLYAWYTSQDNDMGHFALYQTGAKSGRFSAELIQTIPRVDEEKDEQDIRHIRNAFIAPEGYYIVCIDYKQIEMRLFASFANCTALMKHFYAGIDPYLGVASDIWGKQVLKDVKSDDKKIKAKAKGRRRKAKNLALGIIYGMGQYKLADQLDLPTIEAKEILDIFFSKYPVREYMRETISQLYRAGYVSVTLDSPLMRLYREYRVPRELAYKAINIIIQGTAAYVLKSGMKRAYDWLKKEKLDAKLVMCVHDENIFYVSKKYKPEWIIPKLIRQMEDHVTFKVPILADAKYSYKSWGECIEFKEVA